MAIKVSSSFDKNSDVILFPGDVNLLLPDIPDNFVKLIVTSPPYNLGKEYETRMSLQAYLDQQKITITECVNKLSDDGSLCWQVGNFVDNGEIIPLDIVLYPIFNSLGLHLRNRIVWHFGHGLHTSKRFSGRYEVILWFTKTDKYIFNLDDVRVPQKYPNKRYFKGPKKGELSGNPLGKNPTDVWDIPNVKSNHIEKTIHPCQFPVELIERLVLSLTNPGDWVFDPFMGVGSTAIASIIHQRKSIGAELVKEYIDIAHQRIKAAQDGTLKIRPMDRPVYDPNTKISLPPKIVRINPQPTQARLLDQSGEYNVSDKDENNS